MMRYLNMYDSLSCLNCAACMSACSMENRMRMERDAGVDINRGVNEFSYASYYLRPERIEVGEYPDSRLLVGFHHCHHCENAACLNNCPSAAIERRPTGQVVINASACIGCRTCRDACPFDVPFYDPHSGTAKKCIGCYDRVESGLQPACVTVCMTKALLSCPEDEVIAEGERRIARYSERLGRDYILYGKDKINSYVGRLGWVTIAAREDAQYYLLPEDPSKTGMRARNAVKAVGAVGVLAALFDGIKGLWVNYISFGHARIGKFNLGQKLFAWTMIVTITAITTSGFVLMFRDLFSQGTQEFSRFVHAASFVIIGVFLLVHLYLSLLPMNRQSLYAMFRDGNLPIDYVRCHHPIWYEKLTGKKIPEPTTAEKVEQSVADEKLTTP